MFSYENLKKEVCLAYNLVKLDKPSFDAVIKKTKAFQYGLLIIFVPALFNVLLAALNFPTGFGGIFSRHILWEIVIPPISYVLTVFVASYLLKRLMNFKVDGLVSVLLYAGVVFALTVVPFALSLLGVLVGERLLSLIWPIGLVFGVMPVFQVYLEKNLRILGRGRQIAFSLGFIALFVAIKYGMGALLFI